MSYTHTHKLTISSGAAVVVDTTETVTADSEVGYDGSAPGSATTEIDIDFKIAEMKSIMMLASAALTIKTNSSGSPAQTLTLAAGVPFLWKTTDGTLNPITTDVTKLFAVNASATACPLKIRVLRDSTP